MAFRPYLFFGGNCRDAFTRYQEIFGGELQIMTFADLPEGADTMPGAKPEAAAFLPDVEIYYRAVDTALRHNELFAAIRASETGATVNVQEMARELGAAV